MNHNLWVISYLQENIDGPTTYASSCMEYFDLGNRENGTFMIRPNVKLHSFEVQCEFTESQGQVSTERVVWPNETDGNRTVLQKPNKGITIIKTKNLNDINTFPNASARRCTEPNCFTQSIEYHASNEQIEVRMIFANETINY